jgi:hypothetical protein
MAVTDSNVSASWTTNMQRSFRTITLSLEDFATLPHIDVTSGGDDTSFVDEVLADHGLARLVAARLPLHSLVSVLVGSRAVAGSAAGRRRPGRRLSGGDAASAVSFAASHAFDDLAPPARQSSCPPLVTRNATGRRRGRMIPKSNRLAGLYQPRPFTDDQRRLRVLTEHRHIQSCHRSRSCPPTI